MKFVITSCFLFLLQLQILSQSTSNWILIGSNTNNESYLIDKTSYKKNKRRNIEIWSKKVFQSHQFVVSLFEINCLQQKQQVLQFALYNFDGSIVSSSDGDLNDWLRPAPGSIGLLQLNYVCNPSNFINSPHPQKKIIKSKKPKIIL